MEEVISGLLSGFERGELNRRQLIQRLSLVASVSAASTPVLGAESKSFKAVSVNHISYQVADYARARDFYAELLGMKVVYDDGKQSLLRFGNSLLVVRNSRQPDRKPLVDHMCYSLENWDEKAVEAELMRRGLAPRVDNGMTGRSFHVSDPDGFDLQIASTNVEIPSRNTAKP